jgi:DNA-binding NarL/FixJ family response regulator
VAPRYLIVDDNRAFLDAAESLLKREGLDVVGVATTIEEALGRARELSPDVVLVDIMLGDESGFDLARLLVEDGSTPGPGVILISTQHESDFADLISESPALGFVPKSELSARAIERLVDGRD